MKNSIDLIFVQSPFYSGKIGKVAPHKIYVINVMIIDQYRSGDPITDKADNIRFFRNEFLAQPGAKKSGASCHKNWSVIPFHLPYLPLGLV